jgi:hypothetical protein
MDTDKLLLTPGEAGRLFVPPLSSNRVRQLADAGTLPCIRTASGLRLIRQDEVLKLVQKRQQRRSDRANLGGLPE